MFSSGTLPRVCSTAPSSVRCPPPIARSAASARTCTSYCSPPSLYVVTWSPPTSKPQRLGRVRDCTPRSAAFRRSRWTDSSGLPTFSDVSTSTTPGCLRASAEHRAGELLELAEIGAVDRELDLGVLVAAAAESSRPAGRPCAGWPPRTAAARPSRTCVHHGELIARALLQRLQPDVDRAGVLRLRRIVRDRSPACSRPPAAAGPAVAIRLAISSVASRLVPSGARSPTSNSDWSSFGQEVLVRRP